MRKNLLFESPEYLVHRLVLEMDRAADAVLQSELGISYKRFYLLSVLSHLDDATQHDLAVALGHSDPSVSSMLAELQKVGLVSTTVHPRHARKRLVGLTSDARVILKKGERRLHKLFQQLLVDADVDGAHYADLTKRLFMTITHDGESAT